MDANPNAFSVKSSIVIVLWLTTRAMKYFLHFTAPYDPL